MPNIALLNYCNLKCPYCFADDMIAQDNKQMSMTDFEYCLEWLGKAPDVHERIGLIGGEPTLYPNFETIIKKTEQACIDLECNSIIFSNGIELERFIPLLMHTPHVDILLNCNAPENQTPTQYKKLLSTLDCAKKTGLLYTDRLVCGCNIYMDRTDYSYFWKDFVERYNLRVIRCSTVAPGGCYTNEWRHQEKKEEYYLKLKPIFMDFIKEAKRHKIKIAFDCNQIPQCLLTDEEKKLVAETGASFNPPFCEPILDISPDMRLTSCFGSYDLDIMPDINLRDFDDIISARRYVLFNRTFPRAMRNRAGMCENCKDHLTLKCQGGCLSFGDPE